MPQTFGVHPKFHIKTSLTLELPRLDCSFSPLAATHFHVNYSYENLVLHQENNFYMISLSILITCLLDNEKVIEGEVTY